MMHVGFLPHFCLSAQRSPCCCQRAAPAEHIAPQVVGWQCPERSWVPAAPPCTLTDWWNFLLVALLMTTAFWVALLLASHCADLAFVDASPDLPKSPAKLVAPLQRTKKVPSETGWLVCRPQPAAIHSSTAFYHGAVTP